MPRLQQIEETPLTASSATSGGSAPPSGNVFSSAPTVAAAPDTETASCPELPFLVGEVPEAMRRASDGEIAAAFAAVREAYRAKDGSVPSTVTAIEVWQEIQAQRAASARERQQIRRENEKARRRRRQRSIAAVSTVAAGLGLLVVARTILPAAPQIAPSTRTGAAQEEQTFIPGPGAPVVRPGTPVTIPVTPPVTPQIITYSVLSLPEGATGWVDWNTLMHLPQEEALRRRFDGFAPIQQIHSQPVAGTNWQVTRIAGQLYLKGYAVRPPVDALVATAPTTIYSSPQHPDLINGRRPQPINLRIDGQDFGGGFHTLSVGNGGETVQIRIRRYDDRLWQP